jgi:hypothetical protein
MKKYNHLKIIIKAIKIKSITIKSIFANTYICPRGTRGISGSGIVDRVYSGVSGIVDRVE